MLSAAVIVGGSVLVAAVAWRPATTEVAAATARAYEWAFWVAAGVVVVSGVGNLGAFGEGLPDPATAWGRALLAKLALLLALLLVSAMRSALIVRFAYTDGGAPAAPPALGILYALTALLGGAVVALAVWIAHG